MLFTFFVDSGEHLTNTYSVDGLDVDVNQTSISYLSFKC